MWQDFLVTIVMEDSKKIWFSEREVADTELTREELVNEIKRVTELNATPLDKILEIRYLVKHYFVVPETEEINSIT